MKRHPGAACMRWQRTTFAQYCWRPPRLGGTPTAALAGWKHCEGTPRKESVARFTSLYSSVEEPAQGSHASMSFSPSNLLHPDAHEVIEMLSVLTFHGLGATRVAQQKV